MWDFFETVRYRHSVRKYQSQRPVEEEKLHAILETACTAPSAGDLQSYQIIVVTDSKTREALYHAAHEQSFLTEAPICLVFCADINRAGERYGERGCQLYAVQDATIATAYAQLAAVAAGLGSTWIGDFKQEEISQLLGLKENLLPVALLTLGYPAELPPPTPRRPLSEVVNFRNAK
jgi:nitroreductase